MLQNAYKNLSRIIVVSGIASLVALLIGYGIANIPPKTSLLLALGATLFIIAFAKTEYALYFLILAMLISPELVVGAGGGSLYHGRQLVVRLDDLLLLVVGLSWLAKTAIYKELGLFRKTPLNRPILAYALVCSFSTLLGAVFGRLDFTNGFFYVVKYVEYFIIYFMVVNHVREEAQIKRLLQVAFVTCILVSLFALYQIPTGGRVTAPFEGEGGEPNTLGGYLLFMLALSIGMYLNTRNGKGKLLWGGFSFFIFIPFLFTLSRSSWLAAVPMVLVFLVLSPKRLWIAIFLIGGTLLLPLLFPSVVKERIDYTFHQPYHSDQLSIGNRRLDTSASARLRSWQTGLRDWTKHPLFGYGVTGYYFMDAQYVKTLVETGIMGLGVFLWLLFSLFRESGRVYRQIGAHRWYYRGLVQGYIAGLVGLCVHCLGVNTFIIVRIMEPFWFFTGILMILPRVLEGNKGYEPDAIGVKGGEHR